MLVAPLNIILVFVYLAIRWIAQIFFTPKETFYSSLILLRTVLHIYYWIIVCLAVFFGQIQLAAIVLLFILLLIRWCAFYFLRSERKNNSINIFLNRWFSHPYLTTTILELSIFIFSLPYSPLIKLMLIIMTGILCGWYAHSEDMLKLIKSKHSNLNSQSFILTLFFPSQPRLIETTRFSYDTFAFYLWLASIVGGLFAVTHGISLFFLMLAPFCIWLGAAALDRFTVRNLSNYPRGYSFYGGVIAILIEILIFAYFYQWPLLPTLNVFAISCALGHVVGRIGCFAHGCCTGAVSRDYHPYMIAYLHPQHKINRVQKTTHSYCYPSIVIEGILQILIAIACLWWSDRAISIWFIAYGSTRMLVQSFRFRTHISFYVISVLFILLGLVIAIFTAPAPIPYTPSTPLQMTCVVIAAFVLSALYGLKFKSKLFPLRRVG